MIDWGNTAAPLTSPPQPSLGAPPKFVPPKLTNLGDLLDWQRAALQEQIFHKGTSDANRAALRQALADIPPEGTEISGFPMSLPISQLMHYGADHYDEMPHILQGTYDMLLDTVTDPLTLETLDTGALAKGGLRILKPLLDAVDKAHVPVWGPGLVKDVSGAVTRGLNFGGDAIVKQGRAAANTAIGFLNRHSAESRELFRRLQEIDANIMKGLTPSQTSAVQKIMKGQVPASIVKDPIVQSAVKARRELTDNIVRLQAAKKSGGLKTMLGQKFVTGQRVVDHPGFTGVRYQTTPGAPELSARGGTYYNVGKDVFNADNPAYHLQGGSKLHRVEAPLNPKNILHVQGHPGIGAIEHFHGKDATQHLSDAWVDFVNHGYDDELYKTLSDFGIRGQDAEGLVNRSGDFHSLADSVAAKLASKAGYDAILGPKATSGAQELFDISAMGGKRPRFIPFGDTKPIAREYAGTPRGEDFHAPEPSPFVHDKKGRLLTDGGVPILKTPKFVRGPFGKPVRNPALRPIPRKVPLRVTAMAPQALKPLLPGLQEFGGHPGQFTRENYRMNYFPARGEAKAVSADQPARDINLLEQGNPHIKEQSEFHIASRDVDHFEQAFQGMLKTSARSITANKALDELSQIYGGVARIPNEIREIMTMHAPATGAARTVGEKAAQSVKALIGLPKIGIVGTTPIHMFNILSLLAAHAPEQIPEAVYHFVNILKAGGDEAKRFQAMLPAIEQGIDVATHEKGGTVLSKMPLNRWTWDWDTAAKMALASKYKREGRSAMDAGVSATNDLVNYKNTSPLTGMLRWVAPFATFAEGGLKSVLAAVAKRPAQVEAINRATGGAFLGGGNHSADVTSYHPPANVGRGLPSYVRGKTSDMVKLPVAAALDAIPGGKGEGAANWVLSGRSLPGVAADIATSPIPYARTMLDMLPINRGKTLRGYAPDSPLNAGVFASTGISLPAAKPKVPAVTAHPSSGLIDWGGATSTAPQPAGIIDWSHP